MCPPLFDLVSEAAFVASKLAEECEELLKLYLSMNRVPSEFPLPDEWDEDAPAE